VPEPAVPLEIEDALAVRPQHALDLGLRHQRHRPIVIGRLDDHLVRPDAVHPVEQPLALAVERAFHVQRRKLVRHHAQLPPRGIGRAAVVAVRQHFGRRERLVARTERALLAPDGRHRLEAEVVRALLPFVRDDHPSPGDRVLAQLRHRMRSE
jgi:hypothetical protein